tara:strand:- start:2304 stop:4160 length:1857 start_codon:yes stop_codon:yes gene_type:complete
MRNNSLNYINVSILLFISLAFFIGKWLISFSSFPDEDLILKLISESYEDSFMYFHYVKSIVDLNFNNTFSPETSEKGFIVIPIGSLIFHAFGLKFFGIKSFIVLEFLAIFVFLFIFFSIFKRFKIQDLSAISLSSLIFITPLIFSALNFLNIDEINTFSKNFYNLRFPRPLIAQLYFFSFFYILLVSINKNFYEKKFLIPLSIIMSLSLSSFFFIFINQLVSLFIFLIIKYKSNFTKEIRLNYKNILLCIVIFFTVSLPFLTLILNANEDYMERLGVNKISISDKVFLIDHYLSKLFRLKALLLYVTIIFFTIIYKKFFEGNFDIIHIFLIGFVASILSPILFVIFSSKVSFLYHFNNIIIISTVLLMMIFITSFVSKILMKFPLKKFNYFLSTLIILFSVSFFNLENLKRTKVDQKRSEKNQIINLIKENKQINFEETSILTFDNEIMIWAIFNNINYLKIIDGTFTIKRNILVEKDLIETFKFLKLDNKHFESFISNKKIGYRYINPEMRQLFWQKYQANSLFTFKNSNDFENQDLKFIQNSSPFYAHQFAIPEFELKRLSNKFVTIKTNNNFKPDIVMMDKSKKILNEYFLDLNKYCRVLNGDLYTLYFKKELCE